MVSEKIYVDTRLVDLHKGLQRIPERKIDMVGTGSQPFTDPNVPEA